MYIKYSADKKKYYDSLFEADLLIAANIIAYYFKVEKRTFHTVIWDFGFRKQRKVLVLLLY